MKVTCPHCHKPIEFDPAQTPMEYDLLGKIEEGKSASRGEYVVRCPQCGKDHRIPEASDQLPSPK